MRSFEKVAIEKGLTSPQPIKKEAAQKEVAADYSPTSSLLQNIIKLCSGLQKSGLNHYSKDLEEAFFSFKSAETDLYHVHKETGEDFLHSAHPEGSHKMKDMIGDAVIEDLIDQHLKMLQVVEKKPSGKLSSAFDVIRAVKIVLAEDDPMKSSLRSLLSSLNLIDYAYQSQNILTRPITTPSAIIKQVEAFNKLGTISSEQAQKLKIDFNNLRHTYDPGVMGFTGVHRDVWSEMAPYFDRGDQAIDNLLKSISVPKPVSSAVDSIKAMERFTDFAEFNRLKSNAKMKLDRIESLVERNNAKEKMAYKPAVIKWLNETRARIDAIPKKIDVAIKEQFPEGNVDPARKKEIIQFFTNELNEETDDLDNQIAQWRE